jgi:hypothetical protein
VLKVKERDRLQALAEEQAAALESDDDSSEALSASLTVPLAAPQPPVRDFETDSARGIPVAASASDDLTAPSATASPAAVTKLPTTPATPFDAFDDDGEGGVNATAPPPAASVDPFDGFDEDVVV